MIKRPTQQKSGGDGGAEFFAPVNSGYARTDEAPENAPAPPPPTAPPPLQPQAAPPPAQPAPAAAKPPAKPPAKPMDMSSPKEASQVLATTMVQSFVDRMKAEAQAKGGHLSVADLENMQADFDRQAEALSGALEKSFEVYVKARERSVWDQQRDFPFDRLMVSKFSRLFKDGEALGPDDICRRMLPGFFVALGMMLGPEVVEENQEKLRAVVERIRGEGKSVFSWDDVYADKTSKAVSLSSEIAIAQHFDEFMKRSVWFINLINGHLAPVDAGTHTNAAKWELNEEGFRKFLGALMTDLRKQLDTDAGKMAITKRYGAEACASLYDILARVE